MFLFCFGLPLFMPFMSARDTFIQKANTYGVNCILFSSSSHEIFHPIWGAVTVNVLNGSKRFFLALHSELIYQTDFITHLTQDSNNLLHQLLLLPRAARSVSCCYRHWLQTRNSNWFFTQMQRKYVVTPSQLWFEIAIHSNWTAQATKITTKLTKNKKEKIVKTKIDTRSHEMLCTHSFTWNIVYDFTAIFIHFG